MYNLTQKLTAEFLGTFALVFFGAGAICVDFHLRSSGGLGLLAIALASGLAFAIMVSALGHISGGHFNPAITIGYWVTKRLSTLDSLAYWGAQLFGATAAAFFLKLVVPEDIANNVFLGTPELMRDFPRWSGMALEGVTTFFLVLVVFATVVDERGIVPVYCGVRDWPDDHVGYSGRWPAHWWSAQSGASIRACSGVEPLAELGDLLGGPVGRRISGWAAVRLAVFAQARGLTVLGEAEPRRIVWRSITPAAG